MSSALSQLSCFSSINRRVHLLTRSYPPTSPPRSKVLVIRSNDGRGTDLSNAETKTSLNYTVDESKPSNGRSLQPDTSVEEYVTGKEMNEPIEKPVVTQPTRAAKIHDFCFGIPYGGLVLSGGFLGFIFSRNLHSLGISTLFGGALLGLSSISLKVWRQGYSSLPFILGQAVLAAALVWKNIKAYSLTKKIFPTAFYAVISAAMLCFYSYVVISGGNPPPKKLKSSAAGSS